jgi:hypothetical protein
MSAQANVVINDGQATPVAHTFNPKGARVVPDGKDVAVWKDQTPVNADGYLVLTEQHARPNQNGIEKFRWVIEIPTLETVGTNDAGITPAPRRDYTTTAVIEVWASTRASQQELKDIAAYVKNFTALTYFSDAVTKREAAW